MIEISAPPCKYHIYGEAYGSILASLRPTALERDSVPLVLETLRSDETLDAGGLGIWFRALLLWLDLTADDEFADLITFIMSAGVVSGSARTPACGSGLAKRK